MICMKLCVNTIQLNYVIFRIIFFYMLTRRNINLNASVLRGLFTPSI